MKNLTALQEHIKDNRPAVILYNDENDKQELAPFGTLKISLTLDSIHISYNPNTVILKGKSGEMRFNHVKGVEIEAAGCLLGDIITLYCSIGNYKFSHTLIMR